MRGHATEMLLGLLTFAVIGGLLAYATWGGSIQESRGYQVTGWFQRIDGLAVGSEVRVAGIDVGRVTLVRLDPQTERAIVRMRIENDVRVPADSIAMIMSDGLFTDKYIAIEPGADTAFLEDGGRFDVTQGSIDLVGVFQKLIENAEQARGIDPSEAEF